MRTFVVAGTLAAMMAATAFAQTPAPQGQAPQPGANQAAGTEAGRGRRAQMNPEDRAAFLDARIAGLKALLRLTPEQERLWPPVEAALRESATLRAQRMQQWREMRVNPNAAQQDPIQRLRAAAERMTENATAMKKLADAAQPLYATLDANQKRRANAFLNRGRGMMAGRHGMMHHERGMMRGEAGPGMHRGPGGDNRQ
ncbi:hypothetical protein BN1110_05833 [bacterium YEK0313]|nr:hypothetical protein BN1110_05833 [bacterium YEK0313]